MEISAQLVKQLRERTGAGMMECKKALVESKGDPVELRPTATRWVSPLGKVLSQQSVA